MASIRKTRTGSGATAVQVVRYVNRRAVVLKHMGSAHDQAGVDELVDQGSARYEAQAQGPLFPASAGPPLVQWHTFA